MTDGLKFLPGTRAALAGSLTRLAASVPGARASAARDKPLEPVERLKKSRLAERNVAAEDGSSLLLSSVDALLLGLFDDTRESAAAPSPSGQGDLFENLDPPAPPAKADHVIQAARGYSRRYRKAEIRRAFDVKI